MAEKRPRIAVIESDGTLREMFKDLLEFEGYTVVASPDCERGYAFVKQKRPDLIILNVFASCRALGGTTVEQLKADPSTAAIPILICSAAHDALMDGLASKHPGIRWVAQPFEVDDLFNVIESMLAQRGSQAVAA